MQVSLGMTEFHDLLPSQDEPRVRVIKYEVDQHAAEIIRAQRDYDDDVIEGRPSGAAARARKHGLGG